MGFTLVLGGARSGKTAFALRSAQALAGRDRPLVLIATAEALDEEMTERIAHHRLERGDRWRTVEAPLALPRAVSQCEAADVVVVDCLTLWISNLMHGGHNVAARSLDLVSALAASPAEVFVVSNEVGQGIVPDNALARRFRDEVGRAHQALAEAAAAVVFVTAGLPQRLKG